MMQRMLYGMMLFMVLGWTGSACGTDTRKMELVIYGAFNEDVMNPEIAAFKAWALEKHGMAFDVTYIYASTMATFDRVRSEAGHPHADVFLSTGGLEIQARNMELTAPYKVSSWDQILDFAKDPEGYWYAPEMLCYVILYNKRHVRPEEVPKDWADLLDERWRGQLILRDPAESGTAGSLMVSFLSVFGKTLGMDFLYRLDHLVDGEYMHSSSGTVYAVARGEAQLTLWNEAFTLFVIHEKRFRNLGLVYPKSWMTAAPESKCIVKGAPHPESARIWMEYQMSLENAIRLAGEFKRPTRTDLPEDQIPEWLKATRDIPLLPLDWSKVAEVRESWIMEWDTAVRGKGTAYVRAHPEVPAYTVTDAYLVHSTAEK